MKAKRSNIIKEFASFIWEKKAFWLIPVILVSLLLMGLIALAAISPTVAPFIYTIF